MSITELSIKRPSLIIVIFTVLTFLGIMSYSRLNYELVPDMSMPILSITTIYPGASPSEVENAVTKKIEDAVSVLENLESIKSTSIEGVSIVTVQLSASANTDIGMRDAQNKINQVLSSLPSSVKTPSISKFSMTDMPIMRFGITAKMEPTALYAIVKDEITPALSKIKGTARVVTIGGEERVIKVNINRDRAELYHISLTQINQAINNANLDFPTGKLSTTMSETSIKLKGKYQSLDQIRNLVISTDASTGSKIRLSDIATVQDASKDILTFNRIDGKSSIGVSLMKQSDANAVAVSKLVKEELKVIENRYAKKGLKVDIANDSSIFTLEAADAVMEDLVLAIFIVALVMLLFLHSLRNSLIVMIAIPASIISVFIAMYLLNYTLNLMTLLAMSLVVGILVDDSIVVLENIYRHLEMGKDKTTASIEGRQEIGFTAMGITLVDVVVFLPLTMVGGMISDLLGQFSMVIVLSTLMSLFVSFTLTPLLASRMAKVEHLSSKSFFGRFLIAFEGIITKLTNTYGNILAWALAKKRWVLSGTIFLIIASFMLVGSGYIGGEFTTEGDKGEFLINLELPQNATLAQTNDAVKKTEAFLFKDPAVVSVFSSVGTSSDSYGGNSNSQNKAEINVKLVEKEHREHPSDLFAQFTKLDLEKILPGVKVSTAIMNMMGTANEAPISLTISGIDAEKNYKVATDILNKLKAIKGASGAKLSVESGSPELQVSLNRDKMAELGLDIATVGSTMNIAFSGNTDAKYADKQKDYDIQIAYDKFDRKNEEDLRNLVFINNQGQAIKLGQFANFTYSNGFNKLERKNRMPSILITSQAVGVTTSVITEELNQYIKNAHFDEAVSIDSEGDMKYMEETFSNLGLALIASILFVYLIMVALYNSFVYPFVVLFSIPVSIIGALIALALTMQTLNLFSFLGMIMMIGLVAKNGILIVDFTNQLKASGRNTVEALIMSGKARLRPILMTTLAMIIGMMPIAFATGAGAEWKTSLAWVLIGGLSSSMILTLFVVPSIYLIVDLIKGDVKKADVKKLISEVDMDAPLIEAV